MRPAPQLTALRRLRAPIQYKDAPPAPTIAPAHLRISTAHLLIPRPPPQSRPPTSVSPAPPYPPPTSVSPAHLRIPRPPPYPPPTSVSPAHLRIPRPPPYPPPTSVSPAHLRISRPPPYLPHASPYPPRPPPYPPRRRGARGAERRLSPHRYTFHNGGQKDSASDCIHRRRRHGRGHDYRHHRK